MPRGKRICPEGTLFPVLHRGNQPDLNLPNAFLIHALNNLHDLPDGILPHLPGHPE